MASHSPSTRSPSSRPPGSRSGRALDLRNLPDPRVLPDRVRDRIAGAVAEPFGHGDPPLVHTLDHRGDPGLFGPGSVTWRVMGRTTTFIGGIRGLLIQALHPEVVAGVDQHSRYREDPLGRLSRTAHYVTATAFGSMPEAEEAIAFVRRRHRGVEGISHRGRSYDADRPDLAAWVHNALAASFLATHRAYSRHVLTTAEADQFVTEQRRLGALLDADPLPGTAAGLDAWLAEHPAVGPSPGMEEAVAFLRDPPLGRAQTAGYRVLFRAAVATLPDRFCDVLGLSRHRVDHALGAGSDRLLGWAMGDSPAWRAALERTGAAQDVGNFRRAGPAREASGSRGE
ncbi:oxygenase MpaB family protein [Salsipaludibacter albus]|uniref:oxygenase MpaB family protein n=1 Tax=Salsipaludibacter albus TaxID=2849650 RepID=UPI001EE4E3F1|nr:oxygenase MpaB family protein [Salsipaludibacter albus]MBY5161770.1 DUF2236 domain-containing protein [Salsipaludibacter albus]